MSTSLTHGEPGSAWVAIVRKNGTAEFASAFAPGVSLETSVMNGPLVGVEAIGAFFAATSGIYERIAFTHETVDGTKTILEWQGYAFGGEIAGTTVLTRSPAGLIESIRLYHRPLRMVIKFSAELARRLRSTVEPSMFILPI